MRSVYRTDCAFANIEKPNLHWQQNNKNLRFFAVYSRVLLYRNLKVGMLGDGKGVLRGASRGKPRGWGVDPKLGV
jgi:hypothetical protein